MISKSDGWLAAGWISWILYRGECAWASSRSLFPLLITVHVRLTAVLNLSSKLIATILLVVIKFSLFLIHSKRCILCNKLIIVKQLLRCLLWLLPRVIFGFWLEHFGLFFWLILAFHVIVGGSIGGLIVIVGLSTIVGLSSIVGLPAVIPATYLRSLTLTLCLLLKISLSHTHAFSTKSLRFTLTWWRFLRPLNSTVTALFSEIYFLFRITWIISFYSPCVWIKGPDLLCLIRIVPIASKCNLRLILGTCGLVISLIDVVVRSSEWLTYAWLYPIKSLFTFKSLTRLSQREVCFTAWIMVQFDWRIARSKFLRGGWLEASDLFIIAPTRSLVTHLSVKWHFYFEVFSNFY